jgi:hypothetical protein
MSKNIELLSARNMILAAAAILVLSLLGMMVSMLRPRDSGGLARDSFGTRGGGYRALVETLQELGIGVSRSLAPPQPDASERHTLVLLDPNPRLVAIGPKYAQALRSWVEAGGRVVVTPSTAQNILPWIAGAQTDDEDDSKVDILDALGVGEQVSDGEMSVSSAEADYTKLGRGETDSTQSKTDDDDSSLWDAWNARSRDPADPRNSPVTLTGSLAPLAQHVHELALPFEGARTLVAESDDLAGSVTTPGETKESAPNLLVAVLQHGAGEIVVVGDPEIFSNRLIARADNSVLAVNLISPEGQDVVFDEFYHGLAVRGNPLYLLTRPGFAAVTIGLLLLVGVLAWRAAVFLGPPLGDTRARRRDIGEYVAAMGEFFSRGRDSRRFIVHELRDGVLRQVCRELRLPMDTLDVDAITSALVRRDRKRAERLSATIREVDTELAMRGDYPRSSFLPVMQRLANCL